MSKWSNESTGINVLRPLAAEQLARTEKRSRVWSDVQESWGFYADDASEDDAFLLWSSAKSGDRLLLGDKQCVIVSTNRSIDGNSPCLVFKLLSSGRVFDVAVEERDLFKIAKKYI